MKNYPAKMLATMCIILLTTFGCDDLFRQEDAPGGLTADVAKRFYESRATGMLNLKSGNTTGKTIAVKPDWEKSVKSQDDKVEVLTVNLLASRGFGFVDAENEKAFQQTKQVGYMISTTKVVFVRGKKDGSITCFLMTLMGEKGFLEKKNFEIAGGNDYLKKEKDFTGYVLFHNLEGDFVNGWKFTNGKVTHTLSFVTGGSLPVGQKSAYVCTTETFTQWYAYPVDAYVEVGDVSVYKGTTFNYYSVTTLATVCNWVDSTGGGGTYAPSTQPSLTPTADKIIASYNNLVTDQKNLFETALNSFKKQNCGNTAVFNAIYDAGFKINIEMKSNLGYSAGYNAINNTMYFRDNSSITYSSLKEEMVHVYQDSYYPGGTGQYMANGKNTPGYVNIEFEAKVIQDLSSMGCCIALNSAPDAIKNAYLEWIVKVQENSFVFQDADYIKWLNEFNKYQPEYSSPLSNALMSPQALRSISDKFCYN